MKEARLRGEAASRRVNGGRRQESGGWNFSNRRVEGRWHFRAGCPDREYAFPIHNPKLIIASGAAAPAAPCWALSGGSETWEEDSRGTATARLNLGMLLAQNHLHAAPAAVYGETAAANPST